MVPTVPHNTVLTQSSGGQDKLTKEEIQGFQDIYFLTGFSCGSTAEVRQEGRIPPDIILGILVQRSGGMTPIPRSCLGSLLVNVNMDCDQIQ